jgi:hypothetical protein
MWSINPGRVEGGIEPIYCNVKNPDTIEVDKKVSYRPLFEISLKENTSPIDAAELHKTLCWGNINKAGLETVD